MGLDTVELVICIEKEFAIHIADQDAAQIFTVGQLCAYIELCQFTVHGFAAATQDSIHRRVVQILVGQFGIPAKKISRSARFIDDLGLD